MASDNSEIERAIDTWDFDECSVYELEALIKPNVFRVETAPRYDEARGRVGHIIPMSIKEANQIRADLNAGREPIRGGWNDIIWEDE